MGNEVLKFCVGYFATTERKGLDIRDLLRPYDSCLELQYFPRHLIDYDYEMEDRLFLRSNIEHLNSEIRTGRTLLSSVEDVLKNLDSYGDIALAKEKGKLDKVVIYRLNISLDLVEEKELK